MLTSEEQMILEYMKLLLPEQDYTYEVEPSVGNAGKADYCIVSNRTGRKVFVEIRTTKSRSHFEQASKYFISDTINWLRARNAEMFVYIVAPPKQNGWWLKKAKMMFSAEFYTLINQNDLISGITTAANKILLLLNEKRGVEYLHRCALFEDKVGNMPKAANEFRTLADVSLSYTMGLGAGLSQRNLLALNIL